jgi:hypothetical protein
LTKLRLAIRRQECVPSTLPFVQPALPERITHRELELPFGGALLHAFFARGRWT